MNIHLNKYIYMIEADTYVYVHTYLYMDIFTIHNATLNDCFIIIQTSYIHNYTYLNTYIHTHTHMHSFIHTHTHTYLLFNNIQT